MLTVCCTSGRVPYSTLADGTGTRLQANIAGRSGHTSRVRRLRCSCTGRLTAGINDLSISPDGLYVATASDDKRIHLHHFHEPILAPGAADAQGSTSTARPAKYEPLRRLEGHTAPVLCTAFSPKSDCLVSGSFDESVILWDVRRGTALKVLPAHSEAVWTVGWDREAAMVLTGSADGSMCVLR